MIPGIRPSDVVAAMLERASLPLPACLGKVECEWAVAAMCKALAEAGHGWEDAVTLAEARGHVYDGHDSVDLVRVYFACAVRYGWVRAFDMNTYVITPATIVVLASYPPVLAAMARRLSEETNVAG